MIDTSEWPEQLAVIKNARLGVGDYGVPCLVFDAYTSASTVALQVISWDDAYGIMCRVQRDIDLNGKTCYVKTSGNMTIFDRMSEI
jgi:hypothetical protein